MGLLIVSVMVACAVWLVTTEFGHRPFPQGCHLYAHRLDMVYQSAVCFLTGRRHQWRVKVQCKTARDIVLWEVTVAISTKYRYGIEDHRAIKRLLFKQGIKLTYPHLPLPGRGGCFRVEPVIYLGKYQDHQIKRFGGKR